MNTIIAPSGYPFRWKGGEYKINECGILNGIAYANITPPNPELVSEIVKRINRDQGLNLYLGAGFTRFAEDE